jgi:hypothetical protein
MKRLALAIIPCFVPAACQRSQPSEVLTDSSTAEKSGKPASKPTVGVDAVEKANHQQFSQSKKPYLVYYAIDDEIADLSVKPSIAYETGELRRICTIDQKNINWVIVKKSDLLQSRSHSACVEGAIRSLQLREKKLSLNHASVKTDSPPATTSDLIPAVAALSREIFPATEFAPVLYLKTHSNSRPEISGAVLINFEQNDISPSLLNSINAEFPEQAKDSKDYLIRLSWLIKKAIKAPKGLYTDPMCSELDFGCDYP